MSLSKLQEMSGLLSYAHVIPAFKYLLTKVRLSNGCEAISLSRVLAVLASKKVGWKIFKKTKRKIKALTYFRRGYRFTVEDVQDFLKIKYLQYSLDDAKNGYKNGYKRFILYSKKSDIEFRIPSVHTIKTYVTYIQDTKGALLDEKICLNWITTILELCERYPCSIYCIVLDGKLNPKLSVYDAVYKDEKACYEQVVNYLGVIHKICKDEHVANSIRDLKAQFSKRNITCADALDIIQKAMKNETEIAHKLTLPGISVHLRGPFETYITYKKSTLQSYVTYIRNTSGACLREIKALIWIIQILELLERFPCFIHHVMLDGKLNPKVFVYGAVYDDKKACNEQVADFFRLIYGIAAKRSINNNFRDDAPSYSRDLESRCREGKLTPAEIISRLKAILKELQDEEAAKRAEDSSSSFTSDSDSDSGYNSDKF